MYEVLDLSKDTLFANTFNECWYEEVLYTPTVVLTNQYLHYFLWADTPCLKGIQFRWHVFVPNSPMIMGTACVCSNILLIHWTQGIVPVWPCDSNVFKNSSAGDEATLLLQTLVTIDQLTWQNIPLDFHLLPNDF